MKMLMIRRILIPIVFVISPLVVFAFIQFPNVSYFFTGGIFISVLANSDILDYVKLYDLEVKLNTKIQEANVTIYELRKLIKPVYLTAFELLIHFGYPTNGEFKKELGSKLMTLSDELGLSADEEVANLKQRYIEESSNRDK